MASFWQLSGPESHFARTWKGDPCEPVGLAKITSQIFGSMSRELEDGEEVVDVILGIEPCGASHILLPETSAQFLQGLKWRHKNPYPASKYASLSPMQLRNDVLEKMLEDRQSTGTKKKGDNSKANKRFGGGVPRPTRAAFEHGRCFWRILHHELDTQAYGLPSAPWSKGVDIISIAVNIWSADGKTFLDAGLTRVHLPSGGVEDEKSTWYFKSKNCDFLRNSSQEMGIDVSESWNVVEVGNNDETLVGIKIQNILDAHSHPRRSPPAPLVLLVHDFTAIKDSLESMGVRTSTWENGLKGMLEYPDFDRTIPREMMRDSKNSRARSQSPKRTKPTFSRDTRSPPAQVYAPVYVMDTLQMFKTAAESGNDLVTLRPRDVYNKISCNNANDASCAGVDSIYIMQSWRTMVAGPSLEEQRMNNAKSSVDVPEPRQDVGPREWYQADEDPDTHYDESDSEDD